jgi:hypothetical protein
LDKALKKEIRGTKLRPSGPRKTTKYRFTYKAWKYVPTSTQFTSPPRKIAIIIYVKLN